MRKYHLIGTLSLLFLRKKMVFGNLSGSPAQVFQNFPIIEMVPDSIDFLVILMALSGNQDQVAGTGERNGFLYGAFPVGDFQELLAGWHA